MKYFFQPFVISTFLSLMSFSSLSWSAFQSGEAGDRQIFLVEKRTNDLKLFAVKQNSLSGYLNKIKQLHGFRDAAIDPNGSQTTLVVFENQNETMIDQLENVFGETYRITPLSLFMNDHSFTSTEISNAVISQITDNLTRFLQRWKKSKRFLSMPLNHPDLILESFFATHPSATDLLLKCLESIGKRLSLTAKADAVCLEFQHFYQTPQGYQLVILAHSIYIRHGRILSLLRTLHSRANYSLLNEYMAFRDRYFNDVGAALASIVYHPFPASHPSPSSLAISIMNLIHPILPNMGGVSQPTFRSAQADCSSP